jgi:dTDP-4-dehydrorhamnose 3,5-epimerase
VTLPFTFNRLVIPEVVLIEPKVASDKRGCFMEAYKYSDFSSFGIREYFLQDNLSRSTRGVLRGLHYQKNPKAQGKLIRCMKGRIYDVAVDIRNGSASYGKWVGVELVDETNLMVYVPPGFAHGFVALSDVAEVLYKCTQEYSPEEERGIIWNDPQLKISWPIDKPVLSEKDSGLPLLKDADLNFECDLR